MCRVRETRVWRPLGTLALKGKVEAEELVGKAEEEPGREQTRQEQCHRQPGGKEHHQKCQEKQRDLQKQEPEVSIRLKKEEETGGSS